MKSNEELSSILDKIQELGRELGNPACPFDEDATFAGLVTVGLTPNLYDDLAHYIADRERFRIDTCPPFGTYYCAGVKLVREVC